MNDFGTIAGNIGTRVGDTSSTFATTIKKYINQRYERIFKRFNWPTVNPTYTFSTVGGTSEYDLASDFKNELYVFDNTNLIDIQWASLQDLERMYENNLNDNGNPTKYAIYDYMSADTEPLIKKKVRFYPNPTSIIAIKIPYQLQATPMVDSTDLPILRCDIACEYGATADAWRTKRQFAKAADFETQYEQVINEMIWEIENNPNRIVQLAPRTYNRDLLY